MHLGVYNIYRFYKQGSECKSVNKLFKVSRNVI